MQVGTYPRVISGDGATLRGMFTLATTCLERNAAAVNALNVFPVPDGDTGTNMLLTMRSALEEACRCPENGAGAVLQAMGKGAMMGARGNSGVILAQFLRGLASRLEKLDCVTGADLAAGLVEGTTWAYKGVSHPTEGTILTVVREAATAAQSEASRGGHDLTAVLAAATQAALETVRRTPAMLPVLREAGVVDAGGQGLFVLLDGALHYLMGEREARDHGGLGAVDSHWLESLAANPEDGFGYCTEFVLRPRGEAQASAIQDRLVQMGQSVLVVGDPDLVRVHVHTADPGAVLTYAVSLGSLTQVKIQNMDEQHQDFLAARPAPQGRRLVAVAVGDGLTEIFRGLGATVVTGGQTMNPSVQELLQAVQSAPATEMVLLPNNPNILQAANQVPGLSQKEVVVVPTVSIAEGVAAAIAFDPEATLEANVEAMEAARRGVHSGEVTRATRSVTIGGIRARAGQVIGLLNGEMVVAGDDSAEVVCHLLARIGGGPGGLITLYYGEGIAREQADAVAVEVRQRFPEQEVELHLGGQPYYEYLVSVE
ncbi:MAG: DAK2 domain-containing protein [Chloroflexi bacterium]|nr:DAK2 domain-containing protein [Chloroflexota bacterium]